MPIRNNAFASAVSFAEVFLLKKENENEKGDN